MNKQQLSSEKYIQTRARNLPLYKCFVTKDWQEYGMANVVIMRRHVNGNVTAGLYLVDLFCLGIKDTFYLFNEPEEKVFERMNIDDSYLQEIDYNTAHNIIYAGHDFALEFDIQPHKNFSITKFILEEDNDAIPVIDIPVGDENGNPHLIVNSSYNYGPALQKLKEHAGEGNYTFTLNDTNFDDEEYNEEEEEYDEDDENEWEDNEDESEDDEESLEDIETGFLDFYDTAKFETRLLRDALEDHSKEPLDEMIIKTELLWRRLLEEKYELIADKEYLMNTKEFKEYENKMQQWIDSTEKSITEQDKAFEHLKSLIQDDTEMGIQEYIDLLLQYSYNETTAVMLFHGIPLVVLVSEIEKLQNHFSKFPPAVQLTIIAYSVLLQKDSYDRYPLIIQAKTVEEAYPKNKNIHAYHHKCFWLVQALYALHQNDKQKILYYHALLRIVGTGGHIKFLYAAQLNDWLAKYMNVDQDSFLISEYEE
jgi:hypothetical protein